VIEKLVADCSLKLLIWICSLNALQSNT